jgi:hypothetical protein
VLARSCPRHVQERVARHWRVNDRGEHRRLPPGQVSRRPVEVAATGGGQPDVTVAEVGYVGVEPRIVKGAYLRSSLMAISVCSIPASGADWLRP